MWRVYFVMYQWIWSETDIDWYWSLCKTYSKTDRISSSCSSYNNFQFYNFGSLKINKKFSWKYILSWWCNLFCMKCIMKERRQQSICVVYCCVTLCVLMPLVNTQWHWPSLTWHNDVDRLRISFFFSILRFAEWVMARDPLLKTNRN